MKYFEKDYFTEEEYDDFCKDLIISPFTPAFGLGEPKVYYKIYHKILDKDILDSRHPRIARSDEGKRSLIKYRMYQEKRKTYPEIKNCPFCDTKPLDNSLIVERGYDDENYPDGGLLFAHIIICNNHNCLAKGPFSGTELGAIEACNKRCDC